MPELNSSYCAPFTDRERDVLALIAEGRSAKEIALSLGIAPRTVEKHADHVRLKMRAKNRTHMVSIAILSGLLHPKLDRMSIMPDPRPSAGF